MSEQFWKRVKSLVWRASMMAIAVFLSSIAENIGVLELSPQVTVLLGLVLGEVSKWLNNYTIPYEVQKISRKFIKESVLTLQTFLFVIYLK